MLKYRIKGLNKNILFKNEYYPYRSTDKDDNGMYIKKIPLHKYNGQPTLFGIINVRLPSGKITYDVIDSNGQLYAPFYNPGCHATHARFLRSLDKILSAEVDCLDARPKKKRFTRKSKSTS